MSDDEQIQSFNKMFPKSRYGKVLQFYAGFTELKCIRVQDAFRAAIERSLVSNTNDILDLHSDMNDFQGIGDESLNSLIDTFKVMI